MFLNNMCNRLLPHAIPTIFTHRSVIAKEIRNEIITGSLHINTSFHTYNKKTADISIMNASMDSSFMMQTDADISIMDTSMNCDNLTIHSNSTPITDYEVPEASIDDEIYDDNYVHTTDIPYKSGDPVLKNTSTQVSQSFSYDSPRKKVLRRKLYKTEAKLRRNMKRKHSSQHTKQHDFDTFSEICNKYLSHPLQTFFKSQMKLSQTKAKGRRYTSNDKVFALNLSFTSPVAYRLLSHIFILPSKSVISQWQNMCQLSAGFNDNIMQVIKRKTETTLTGTNIAPFF